MQVNFFSKATRWVAITAVLFCTSAFAADNARPNIVFVLADDLGFGDIGTFYQNFRKEQNNRAKPWLNTPQLDKMAAEGIKLIDHYCAAPVCAPSRASLLLGVHQGHANVRDNQFDKALENNHTLATVLKAAGYATAAFGKWGLQGKGKDPSTWQAYPTKRGFDYYFGYVRHRDGHEHYPKEGPHKGPKEVWDGDRDVSANLDKCYTADLWAARAKKWIVDQHSINAAQPFFVYLAFDTPHATQEYPAQPYPAGGGIHGGVQWLGTKGHMINTANGVVDSWCHPDYANATFDDDGDPKTAEVPWPEVYKRYATAIRRVDDCVGDVLQLLRELHLDTNTLVVFTSDNGPSIESYLQQKLAANFFNSFGPFDGIKRDVWEGGFRVPTIVWWPGQIAPGRTSGEPSESQDWMATFADAARLSAPARCDGVSLLPLLTGQSKQRKSVIYCEYFENGKTPNYPEFAPDHRGRVRNQMQAIRIGNYQGVRYDVKSHSDNFEIYNLANDPGERVNLAGSPEMAKLQQEMKDRVLRLRRLDAEAPRPYDKEFIPPAQSNSTQPGVEWSAYNHQFPWVPELSAMAPDSTGTTGQPTVSVRERDNDIGLLFSGYIAIPTDGDYTFFLTADTGALLRIHEATVIDADFGYKGGTEKSGAIRLKAGKHPFRLYYARRSKGAPFLKFLWSSPSFGKQPIPAGAFFRNNTSLSNVEQLR